MVMMSGLHVDRTEQCLWFIVLGNGCALSVYLFIEADLTLF